MISNKQDIGEYCIPALPVHLRDLTYAEEGTDRLKVEGEIEVINVSKMLKVSMNIYHILRYRPPVVYPMSARSTRHVSFLKEVVFVDRNEEALFEISDTLKPRSVISAEAANIQLSPA